MHCNTNENKFAFWGFGFPEGYNASAFQEICFSVFTEQPNQALSLNLKDKNRTEKKVTINIKNSEEWVEICTPLSKFSEQGIQLERLDNINLGFTKETGDSTIWVGDFELK